MAASASLVYYRENHLFHRFAIRVGFTGVGMRYLASC